MTPNMRGSMTLLLVASFSSMSGCGGGGEESPAGHALPSSYELVATDRSLDVGIDGDGLFVLETADGRQRSYSRLGRLDLDGEGRLIHADGSTVLGFSTEPDAAGAAALEPLPKAAPTMPVRPTTTVAVEANLDARVAAVFPPPDPMSVFDPFNPASYEFATSIDVYAADTTPARHTLTLYFSKLDMEATTGAAIWVVHASIDGRVVNANLRLRFLATGALDTTIPATLRIPAADAALPTPLDVDLRSLYNYAAFASVISIAQDGYGHGVLASASVEPDGRLALFYDNGQKAYAGSLALARFTVADRLQYLGDSSRLCGLGCVQPTIGTPGSALLGRLRAKALNAVYR